MSWEVRLGPYGVCGMGCSLSLAPWEPWSLGRGHAYPRVTRPLCASSFAAPHGPSLPSLIDMEAGVSPPKSHFAVDKGPAERRVIDSSSAGRHSTVWEPAQCGRAAEPHQPAKKTAHEVWRALRNYGRLKPHVFLMGG